MAAETKNSKRRKWLTAYAPLVIWMALILGLGSGFGSMNETSRVIRPLLEFFFPAASPETLTLYHGYIRKFAHFAEYAVLGFLACRALTGIRFRYLIALVLVVLVASADEINQSFNPARTSSPWDVALDVLGGSAMIGIFALISSRSRASNAEARTK